MSDQQFSASTTSLLDEHRDRLDGQVARDHALVSFVESHRHFWSPWLHLELRKSDSSRQIYGRFSPHPSIWTGFMFSYLALAVTAFFACIFGLAQTLAGESAWAFWVMPACAVIAVLLWIAARTGQRLAHQQMVELTELVQEWITDS
jgi:hypothetical protein